MNTKRMVMVGVLWTLIVFWYEISINLKNSAFVESAKIVEILARF